MRDLRDVLSQGSDRIDPALEEFFAASAHSPQSTIEADARVRIFRSLRTARVVMFGQHFQESFCAGFLAKIGEASRPMAKERFLLVKRLFYRCCD